MYISVPLEFRKQTETAVAVSRIRFEATGPEFQRDPIKFRERNGFSPGGL